METALSWTNLTAFALEPPSECGPYGVNGCQRSPNPVKHLSKHHRNTNRRLLGQGISDIALATARLIRSMFSSPFRPYARPVTAVQDLLSLTPVYEEVEGGWTQAGLKELPGVITAAASREEARELLLDALREFLLSFNPGPASDPDNADPSDVLTLAVHVGRAPVARSITSARERAVSDPP